MTSIRRTLASTPASAPTFLRRALRSKTTRPTRQRQVHHHGNTGNDNALEMGNSSFVSSTGISPFSFADGTDAAAPPAILR